MVNTEALQRTYDKTRQNWDPHFEWVVNDSAPWMPLQQPLAQTSLALVSTCGAYRRDVGCAFANHSRIDRRSRNTEPRMLHSGFCV